MVDSKKPQRIAPASPPGNYRTFSSWLESAVERRGMKSELARYCDVERQNIDKWLNGSLPAGPTLRKLIAEWAQVEYPELRELLDKDEERREEIAASPAIRSRKSKSRLALVRAR